jgi:hypothetical protein
MRPDDRLLLPASALPFVPEGARLWVGRLSTAAVLPGGTAAVCTTLGLMSLPDVLVDLSAPTLRDGVPERGDLLPWALRVLNPRARHARKGAGGGVFELYGNDGHNIAPVGVIASCPIGIFTCEIVVRKWPDLSGLSPDDASRAVVVAALRQGATP